MKLVNIKINILRCTVREISKHTHTHTLYFKLFHCHFLANPTNSLCMCSVQLYRTCIGMGGTGFALPFWWEICRKATFKNTDAYMSHNCYVFLTETGREDVDWIYLGKDRDPWPFLVDMVIQFRVPLHLSNFFNICGTISFLREHCCTGLHTVG